MVKSPTSATVSLLLFWSLLGCVPRGIGELHKEEQFALSLGRMEDQIDLFQPDGEVMRGKNTLFMRDGLFYVANGNAGKIMVFSSYGDLIFLLYDPAENPRPVSLNADSGVVSTRDSVAYPFRGIGEVTVDSDKDLFVDDEAPGTAVQTDDSTGVRLNRLVQRFDRKGRHLASIGQEGIGGTPFPFIMALHVTAKDQLVVVCRTSSRWLIFWYSKQGELLYRWEVNPEVPPFPVDAGVMPFLECIFPDMQNPILHVMFQFFRETPGKTKTTGAASGTAAGAASGTAAGAALGIENFSSRIYRIDVRTGKVVSMTELPRAAIRKEKLQLKTVEVPGPTGDLMGVSSKGFYYLLGYSDANLYTLSVVEPQGRVRERRYVIIEDSELTFRDLHLTPSGLLYGLLCDAHRAHIAWWRSDSLLKGE
jgi:hypothetical protein